MHSTRTAEFPVLLAFPPQGHWTQPHLAIPSLVAWLRAEGYSNVHQMDLSVEAFDHFLTPAYLARAKAKAEARLPLERLQAAESLPLGQARAWRAAVEAAVSADALIARVDAAKRLVRGQDAAHDGARGFWDPDRYLPAVRTLYHGLRLVSAAHYPSELTPHNFTMRYSNDRSHEVLAATLDEDENPFLAFYRECVLPRIVALRPRVLGLSVLYGSQLVPALTLGRLVKAALPDCHVTAGGGYLAYVGKKVMQAAGIDACLDSIVFHEGEAPLLALCDALRGAQGELRNYDALRGAQGELRNEVLRAAGSAPGIALRADLSLVGSLVWFDRRGGGAKPTFNLPAHPIKLDAAPAPDLDGLPFDKYFSPRLVVPYDVNRGCYYGECTFCTLPTVIGPGYRTRSAETIARHVLELRDRYATTHFNFITDCMPPGLLEDLPQRLIADSAGITWWADARVEPKSYTPAGTKLLYDSGCRKLLFGFESASKRILKMMMKGQSLKSVIEVAQNCAKADISVTFYAMVGFPTETREEARATLRFLEEHAGTVREVSLQTFHIDEVALTYREPERFGLKILDDPGADLALYHDYEAESGMTQEEAAEMFEELMASFRRNLPLFGGDNVFYFMQKSHYFLHLAGTPERDAETPDSFEQRLRARLERRAARGVDGALRVRPGLASVPLSFGYKGARELIAHPLARAARPDFLTGRFVGDAEQLAEGRLPHLPRTSSVLVYDGDSAEFVELRPDGLAVLRALERAGSLDELARAASAAGRARLEAFAAELHRLGILTGEQVRESHDTTLTPRRAASVIPRSTAIQESQHAPQS
jgi:anaerobic magnesium-protoporphyrin IX monomethyl ester cyclase